MAAAVCCAFDDTKVDSDIVLHGDLSDIVEVAIFDADRLACVMRIEFFLQAGIKPGAFGSFYPERIARNQRLTKGNQLAAISRGPTNPVNNFGEAGVALQPDWRNLRQSGY